MYYTRFDTLFCEVILAGNEKGLSHLHLNTPEGKRRFEISKAWMLNHDFFADSITQIRAYFSGKRLKFNVTVNPQGTDFQKRVWRALSEIPYGELRTYKDIAKAIGNENAARAVGMANSKNPVPLIIPCHRVIGANGNLTGFAHGLAIKEKLINLEQGGFTDCI
ncbi:Methylated-DNA--protein-cysteine methyltransferase [Desulfonema magnum]|uniref:Methylated-DNA--protein-cysteine methyltransferase n=2 Tax=Desulfonema magnum TaxID=45655 RepID=A0A975BY58_9BACT|nr:Methylated-DNA--protein-cysteine methyltransferase [Desulfonema magnum]